MTPERFNSITSSYAGLKVAIVGDFCLDRYLEIDPARAEHSIETGLPVHNVVNVRAQPGGAGTILNNLAALGIGTVYPVGFCGWDGEGFELHTALGAIPCVRLEFFKMTPERQTFTYCKPLVLEPGQPPRELNRLDTKNWSPTPEAVQGQIISAIRELASHVDAFIVLDQVDIPETGVVTNAVLEVIGSVSAARPNQFTIADSRRSLKGFPPVVFKMNGSEFATLSGVRETTDLEHLKQLAARHAQASGKPIFITLSERGMLGAGPDGSVAHQPSLPLRGPIDIVGAGDSVTANLTAAMASGANLAEAIALANAAASLVIHQLGTTGVATVGQIQKLLF